VNICIVRGHSFTRKRAGSSGAVPHLFAVCKLPVTSSDTDTRWSDTRWSDTRWSDTRLSDTRWSYSPKGFSVVSEKAIQTFEELHVVIFL
jgi:hypothetical protein